MFILPTYDLNKDIEDFQKVGNFQNFMFGIHYCPDLRLLPFRTPNVVHDATVTITDFELRRLRVIGNEKTIIATTDISPVYIFTKSGINFDYHYFKANVAMANVATGVYQMYLKDSNNNEFITDLIYISNSCDLFTGTGDFNNDFSSDFYNFNPAYNLSPSIVAGLTGWSQYVASQWSYSGGYAQMSVGSVPPSCLYVNSLTSGKQYRIKLNLVASSVAVGEGIQIQCGTKNIIFQAPSVNNSAIYGTSQYIEITLTANGTEFSILAYGTNFIYDVKINQVEVYEI